MKTSVPSPSPTLYQPLPRKFYSRDTHVVARALLGKLVVRQWRNQQLVGRITEVESYVGESDRACHASKGRTPRTEVMFGQPGHAYVYLIYGMYDLLNIVTERVGFPAAVLIRALEPVSGLSAMKRYRNTPHTSKLTTGPGKLTQALQITRAQNGLDLIQGAKLFVASDGQSVSAGKIAQGPRIGVDYAGADALLPWRYTIKDSAFLSQP